MDKLKLIEKMSPKSRIYCVLSELDKNGKITVLSEEESYKINKSLEEEYKKIREIYLAQEMATRLSLKPSILI
jgi:hypothetical protein